MVRGLRGCGFAAVLTTSQYLVELSLCEGGLLDVRGSFVAKGAVGVEGYDLLSVFFYCDLASGQQATEYG